MLEYRRRRGLETMGLMASQAWYDDPKRLAFTLSRYKFVAKMLAGSEHVLEVGCADAFATRVVVQEVKKLTAVDFDPLFVDDTNSRMSDRWKFECRVHDMLADPVAGQFDGAYALDVLEHIVPELGVSHYLLDHAVQGTGIVLIQIAEGLVIFLTQGSHQIPFFVCELGAQ